MKKLLLITFLLTPFVALIAQPTITSSINGGIGDEFNYIDVQTEGLNPGPAGENVTWDFSDIIESGAEYGYTWVDVASTPDGGDFPGANIAADNGPGTYSYFKVTASEFTNYGVSAAGSIVVYQDPEEIFVFPMTYGTTNTDDLFSEFINGIAFERSGTVTMEVDAYGTLILPSGTYTDVLRVKVKEDYMDEADLLPTPIIYDFTNYYWLKAGVKGPLFQYFDLVTDGGFPFEDQQAAYAENVAVGIAEHNTIQSLTIFPNPVKEVATIIVPEGINSAAISIYNNLGQVVTSTVETVNHNTITLPVGYLQSGIYMIALTEGDNTYNAKMIKR
ncbi:MAG TPA: T9SS type A sorting domain-containing protein [Chitinophagales bacterium]|nr:T9SS type A sorting domain-containing protein [Chitinophagales bacterium]HRG27098.1 T9SS type A sorting domain-containing protein [Chitinophagales bacterium]HRG85178.1 T9SS type A sorting domain-containing protein [Chitinophagales bacterium]HRH52479.1 T9SS type A sorting domain-containing protein [Chitinophagales bacterium]